MQLNLHHISITSKNLIKSKQFYEKLGFKETVKEYSDSECIIIILSNNFFCIEIFYFKNIENLKKNKKLNIYESIKNNGITHFATSIKEPDFNNIYREFKEKNITKTEITKGRLGFEYFFIEDPDCNLIEIIKEINE